MVDKSDEDVTVEEDNGQKASYPLCQSPLRLQLHMDHIEVPFHDQLLNECRWFFSTQQMLICFSHEVPSRLQDGPQCGMVALWMAMKSLIGDAVLPSVDDIQDRAAELYFSSCGEMFSANNMAKLCNDLFSDFNCKATLGKSFRSDFGKSFQDSLNLFLNEDQRILIPFDNGPDQRPGLRKGHRAHWAVLSGLAVSVPLCDFDFNTRKIKDLLLVDEMCLIVLDAKKAMGNPEIFNLFPKAVDNFFFVARQSKSRRVFLYESQILSASNSNLIEFRANPAKPQHLNYIIPPGGVREGLSGKYVIVKRKQS